MMVRIRATASCARLGHKWHTADGFTRDGLFLDECERCGRKVWRQRPFTKETFMYDEAPKLATVLRNTVLTMAAVALVVFWFIMLWPLFR